MSGNLLVRFDEGRVGRTTVSPSLLLYREIGQPAATSNVSLRAFNKLGENFRECGTIANRPCAVSLTFGCGDAALRDTAGRFLRPPRTIIASCVLYR